MGNQLIVQDIANIQPRGILQKYKWNQQKNKQHRHDEFIIELSHSYQSKLHQITDINHVDPRRTVFVSLVGLYQTYKSCPCQVLYSSVLVLPIKKDWIYNLQKYINKDDEYPLDIFTKLSIFNSLIEIQTFLKLLQWKDSQGLLFCMMDEYKYDNNSLIHPFWKYLSNKLSNLYDTITDKMYNPLKLDDKGWENAYRNNEYESRYNTNASSIMSELYFLRMNYNTMKEIIYQSNPLSLNPITFYGENADRFKKYKLINRVNENEEEWYISIDYFE